MIWSDNGQFEGLCGATRRTAKEPVYKQSDKFPAYNTQLPLALAMVA